MIKKIYYAVLSLVPLSILSYLLNFAIQLNDGYVFTSMEKMFFWVIVVAFATMVVVTCYNVGNLIYDYLKKKKSEETKTDTKDKTEE